MNTYMYIDIYIYICICICIYICTHIDIHIYSLYYVFDMYTTCAIYSHALSSFQAVVFGASTVRSPVKRDPEVPVRGVPRDSRPGGGNRSISVVYP